MEDIINRKLDEINLTKIRSGDILNIHKNYASTEYTVSPKEVLGNTH